MQGQAQDLGGNWIAVNDLNFSERYLDAVKRVKPADLQRVAREYFTAANRTLYALLPAGAMPKAIAASGRSAENAIQKFALPNGLRLLLKEDHRLPFVEFRAVFKGGREMQLAALKAQKDQLLQSCFRAMRRAMFGETGYGLDALGSEDSVPELKAAGLKSFHQELAVPNNCVLAIYGDIQVKQVVAAVRKAFVRWTPNNALSSLDRIGIAQSALRNGSSRAVEIRDKKQAALVVSFPGST